MVQIQSIGQMSKAIENAKKSSLFVQPTSMRSLHPNLSARHEIARR